MAKKNILQDGVIKTVKPALTFGDFMTQVEVLMSFPTSVDKKAIVFDKKTGEPVKFRNKKVFSDNLTVGLNYDTIPLHPNVKSIIKSFGQKGVIVSFNDNFYTFQYWNDTINVYEDVTIRKVKPTVVK